MPPPEFLYNYNSVVITLVLFFCIVLMNELGFRLGYRKHTQADDESKSLTSSVQGSILGLLALLLGFTFSMSMQRYDNRCQALIAETNAIGTLLLRVKLLPTEYQAQTNTLLAEYLKLRIAIGHTDLTQQNQRQAYDQQINHIQNQLWSIAVNATDKDARPVTTGAFINSLNEMIDSQGKRNALLQLHVPEVILMLLFMIFITSGGILGYSSGLNGRRITIPTLIVVFLITLIVFLIIDLDRPKRGLIQVNQSLMEELQISPAP